MGVINPVSIALMLIIFAIAATVVINVVKDVLNTKETTNNKNNGKRETPSSYIRRKGL